MQMYDEKERIYYEIKEDGRGKYAVVTDADKKINEIVIPGKLGDHEVRSIGKKAFLGCKGLRYVLLPSGVDSVGEWAFAFCDNLSRVDIPRRQIDFGKGVFKNDNELRELFVYDSTNTPAGRDGSCAERELMVSRLMAHAPVVMDAEYLLDAFHAGSSEWLRKWDTRLEHILSLKDDDGYHLYVLCGEEDLHFDYEEYLEYNREKKSALCMLRLVNDIALDDDKREVLASYLKEHTSGCGSDAALRVLLKRHGDEKEYYRLMLDVGAINEDNLEQVLNAMGDRHAQMKAYLIEECRNAGGDFFDDLML